MLELTSENVLGYLRDRRWIGPGPARVEPLGGGVSNAVLRVETPERVFVLKQSRPQLRTRDTWLSDIDRVFREQEVMQALRPLLPEPTVPAVLFSDRANYAFVMSAAPTGSGVWKQALLAGEVDLRVGALAGSVLGRLHEATARQPELVEPFRDHTVFVQLRVDPFYRRVQQRRPEVAAAVEPIIERMLSVKEALCHGDYTPKNILIIERMLSVKEALCHGDYTPKNILPHDRGFTLVDYETAHWGDPTMDLGLFLCHLVLKAFKHDRLRPQFVELTRAFWNGYAQELRYRPLAECQALALGHFAVCLLARIDGTSPVDYLPEEPKREAVRRLARMILLENPSRWDEILAFL
jgi:5-methylthioribose kinase